MSGNAPKISVVIPHYRQEKYLIDALFSVAAQSFHPDEVIVVDDASGGDMPRLPEKLKSQLNLKWVSLDRNRGVAAARNRGIMEAQGSFLAFLDADDLWTPLHLENFVRCFKKHPQIRFYSAGSVLFRRNPHPIRQKNRVSCYKDNYFKRAVRNAMVCNPSSVILHRLSLGEADFFDENLIVFEDIDMWIRLGRKHLMYFSDTPSVKIRLDTPGSLSKDTGKYNEDLLRYFFDKHLKDISTRDERRFVHLNILGILLMYKFYGRKEPAFLREYLDTALLSPYEKFKYHLPAPVFRWLRRIRFYFR